MKLMESPFPRLGAFFVSYDANPSHTDLLNRFKKIGLTSAQIGDPFIANLIADPSRRAGFVRDFQEAGIGIAGIAAYRNLVAPDPAKRRENIDYVKAALKLAPELGTFAVATETGTLNAASDWEPSLENSSPRAWAMMLESVEELVGTAEAHGSILAIEGYVNNIVGRLDHLDALFSRFTSRQIAPMLDPYNYISRDLLPVADLICREFLDRYADRFVIAHLKDVAPLGADGVPDQEAGRADLVGTPEFCTGVFPQQGYMRFLRDRRPDLPIIFEHLPEENIPGAVEKFRALTGRLAG
ncbi:MAG: sugar phosphate isomerase/epimerase [Saprospiraceae bacterium]